VSTLAILAKRLIDYGFHPYTVSFPLIVHGAMDELSRPDGEQTGSSICLSTRLSNIAKGSGKKILQFVSFQGAS